MDQHVALAGGLRPHLLGLGEQRLGLLELELAAELVLHARLGIAERLLPGRTDIGEPHTIGRQQAGHRMQQNALHPQRIGHQAGMLATGTAEAVQRIAGDIVAALDGNLLDRLDHIGNRDTDEAVCHLFGASVITDPRGKFGEFRPDGLDVERLVTLDRFAERSAEQLVEALDASKQQPLSKLLFALGIANIGEIAAKQIARHFGSMDAIANATAGDVLAIHGIGAILAESLVSWFSDKKARKLIERLGKRGLTFTEPTAQSGDALKGQTVVITGTLPGLSREQASALVEAHGGRVASSVSKKTSFVLVGADAGSKFEKARELGVKTIDEAQFREMIGG